MKLFKGIVPAVAAFAIGISGNAAAQVMVVEDLGDGILSITEENEGHIWGAYGDCSWTLEDGIVPDGENFGGPPGYPENDIWTHADTGGAAILNLNNLPEGQDEVLIAIYDPDADEFGHECVTVADYLAVGPPPPPPISLNPTSTFPIDGDEFTLSLTNVDSITGAAWTKDGAPAVTKSVSSGGGATDTFLTFDPLGLSDSGEYCVTGTTTVDAEDIDIDACYDLSSGDIAESGSSIPVGGGLMLSVLAAMMACVGVSVLRRQVS